MNLTIKSSALLIFIAFLSHSMAAQPVGLSISGKGSLRPAIKAESDSRNGPPPINLQANQIGYDAVLLTWEMDVPGEWIHWDSGNNYDGLGAGNFGVSARWLPEHLAQFQNHSINAVKFFPRSTMDATFVLRIFKGANAGELLYIDTLTNIIHDQWNTIVLTESLPVDAGEELWVGFWITHPVADYPMGIDHGPVAYGLGDMVSLDGTTWMPLSGYGYDNNWNIQASVIENSGSNFSQSVEQFLPRYGNDFFEPDKLPASAGALNENSANELLGFNVYRNDILTAQLSVVFDYLDVGIPPGMHSYTVRAVYPGGLSEPAGPVYAYFPPTEPKINFNPEEVITYHSPPMITNEVLYITNTGTDVLYFNISFAYPESNLKQKNATETVNWLAAVPMSGTVSQGQTIAITLTFDSNQDPSPHGYYAYVVFESNDPESPHHVPAMIMPAAPPCLFIEPDVLFEVHNNPPQYTSQSLQLTNVCSFEIDFAVEVEFLGRDLDKKLWPAQNADQSDYSWLTVQPADGIIPPYESATLSIGFNSSGLISPDIYHAALIISTSDIINPIKTVNVTFQVEGCGLPAVEGFSCGYLSFPTVILEWNPPQETNGFLSWCEPINYAGFGLENGETFIAAVKFLPDHLSAFQHWKLSSIAFYPTSGMADYTLKVWIGDVLALSQPVTNPIPDTWNEVELTSIVQIDSGQELRFGYEATYDAGDSPAGIDGGPAISGFGDLLYYSGGWTTLNALGYNNSWNLTGTLEWMNPASTDELNAGKNSRTELLGYNLYRDSELIVTLPPDANIFIDYDPGVGGNQKYAIGAVYQMCESMSPECTPPIIPPPGVEKMEKATVKIYPNPTSGIFTIEGSANHAKVTVFNAHGVEVYHGEQALPAVIDLTEQPRGVYFIRIETEDSVVFGKIVRD